MALYTTESLSLESSSSALEHVPVLAPLSGVYFSLKICFGFEDAFRLFVASFTRG